MYKLIVIAIILLTIPTSAQEPCGDLDCNGYCLEISDFVMALRIIGERCEFDSLEQCTLFEGDVNHDGYPITIADAMTMSFAIFGSSFPDFPRHPESDTIEVGSAIASPGETIELPVYIRTIDTVTAFQISIKTYPDYVTLDTLVVLDNFFFISSYCSGQIYGCFFDDGIFLGNQITLLPGEYHIANLVLTISPEIYEPVTTEITFSNNPELLQYTAFSNGPFFTPVTVDGVVEIITTGIENGECNNIPGKLSINAYPNPFNASTILEYVLPVPRYVRIYIYDLLGRQIEMLVDEDKPAGQHQVVWNASDRPSGIYFYRLETGDLEETSKLILLK